MSDIWKPELFEIALPCGPTKKAGYTHCGLGLYIEIDASPKGGRPAQWSLTHLNTGHRVCSLIGNVSTVFPIATEIAEAGDWDFLSLEGWKDRFPNAGAVVKEILDRHIKAKPRRGFIQGLKANLAVAQQIASNRP